MDYKLKIKTGFGKIKRIRPITSGQNGGESKDFSIMDNLLTYSHQLRDEKPKIVGEGMRKGIHVVKVVSLSSLGSLGSIGPGSRARKRKFNITLKEVDNVI
ncbi:MAG TPA: hypothetical protein VK186_09050 [Candidatus Deferrimicrobium sp.]|nr:hypothetical protein [Candidatus Kapabacteria bacterium]HLP58965.1 hypothetical protein [Candidatus Deferrimicrobium sp.]